ncbi:type II toxin-antitoxin system HicA family toxin [Patescibacteria group bacterium]|nr:type II toxin-antitoxin system HicA family toxin [Patescibacteria group bacterium]
MPKLYSSKDIIKILEKNGFKFISQKGSHIKYRKFINPISTVIIPANCREIPIGTFKSILRQSKLNKNDFTK